MVYEDYGIIALLGFNNTAITPFLLSKDNKSSGLHFAYRQWGDKTL